MGEKHIAIQKKVIKEMDKMTRWDFEAHMKSFMKKLLTDPINAKVDDYLLAHGIDTNDARQMLMDNGIIKRSETIRANEETGEDDFVVSYKIPRKDFSKKMRRLSILKLEPNIINECDGGCIGGDMGGATFTGQYSAPIFGQVIKKKGVKNVIVTQEQVDFLKEAFAGGNFPIYDVPMATDEDDPTLKRKNICTGDEPVGHKG